MHALRLRWSWYELKEPSKLWVELENSCSEENPWDSPWLLGRKPNNIAPLIYEILRRKNRKVCEALKDNAWILKINPPSIVSVEHIGEFFTLRMLAIDFHLNEITEDDIV